MTNGGERHGPSFLSTAQRNQDDDLPPSPRGKLSATGWIALTGSLVLGAALFFLPLLMANKSSRFYPLMPFFFYALSVVIGWIVCIPGGMHYQGDIDSFLAKNPSLTRADLPWPAHYDALTSRQQYRYAMRGVWGGIAGGLLTPVFMILLGCASLRIVKEAVVERFVEGLFRPYGI